MTADTLPLLTAGFTRNPNESHTEVTMRKIWLPMLSLCFLLSPAMLRSDENGARAVVDRALKSQGGEKQIAQFRARQEKVKGTLFAGKELPFVQEITFQYPNQIRELIQFEANDRQIKMLTVLNGDDGWMRIDDKTEKLDDNKTSVFKEAAHLARLTNLHGLNDPQIQLSAVAETKVDGKPAAGVKVSAKGCGDVSLYFDKETGLLVKAERQAKDFNDGKPYREDSFFSGWKEINGVKTPTKVVVFRDGNKYIEQEATEVKLLDKVDEAAFAKP